MGLHFLSLSLTDVSKRSNDFTSSASPSFDTAAHLNALIVLRVTFFE